MEDAPDYNRTREKAFNYYKGIGVVFSPALKGKVHFDSQGFNHLIYKRKNKERNKREQVFKFKLINKARQIIEIATTFQEYDEGLLEMQRKKYKKRVLETIVVKYWGLVAVIDDYRIKVIIRQMGNGEKHFWSVIPAWTTKQYKGIKIIRQAKGDLSED